MSRALVLWTCFADGQRADALHFRIAENGGVFEIVDHELRCIHAPEELASDREGRHAEHPARDRFIAVGAQALLDGLRIDPRFDGRDRRSAVWGASPNEVFAAGWKILLHLEDGVWSVDRSFDDIFVDLWGSGPDDVYAVGYSASYHFDGGFWSELDMNGAGPEIRGVWGTGPADVFAVGYGGTIVHFDGVTWEPMTSGTTLELRSVWGSGPGDVWAVGGDSGTLEGVVLHYDGQGWSEVQPQLIDQLALRVAGRGPGDVYMIGIHALMQGRTALVVAHRLSTIQDVDRIYVLDHGRLAESGTHAELLALGGLYERLYHLQYEAPPRPPVAAVGA